jgi:hypothetical protein
MKRLKTASAVKGRSVLMHGTSADGTSDIMRKETIIYTLSGRY